MTDYTQNEDYSAKDALSTGDSEKLILGSDIDSELAEIQTAIGSKYDSTDLATQAQAEAESSGTTLISPLRLANWADANAGMAGDIQALSDPGADRVLFWDDSASAVGVMTLGTGLSLTATTLTVDVSAIGGDLLVDHTGVSVIAGTALAGGGTIDSDVTLNLDITELTADATPNVAADYIVTYDASAAAHKKVLLSNVSGLSVVGSGSWTRATSAQSLSADTEATVIYNSEVYDALQNGSYSTSTGLYTAGSSAVRLLVSASVDIAALDSGGPNVSEVFLRIHNNSVEVGEVIAYNAADPGNPFQTSAQIVQCVNVSATEAVRIRARSGTAESISTGTGTVLSIVELP